MIQKKTVEEHKYYLNEIVKLSLWILADYYNKNKVDDFKELIDRKTPLYNHTTFNKHHLLDVSKPKPPIWDEIKVKLHNLILKNSDPKVFEQWGYELLKPYIDGRAERDIHNLHLIEPGEEDLEESWVRYDLDGKGDKLELHIENSLYPKSFLSDKDHFYKMLRIAVNDAKKYGYKILCAHTWLNSYSKFLDLMPKEWNESRSDTHYDIWFHLGFWGQFFRSNDTFNEKTAAHLRKTGRIKYPTTYCEATVEDFEIFLAALS